MHSSNRFRHGMRSTIVAVVVSACGAASLGGQVIRGKAVEFRSDLPVAHATVTLLDENRKETTVATATDSVGRYSIAVPSTGRYSVRVRQHGYEAFTSIIVSIGKTDTVEVDLWPEANADLVDSLLKLSGHPSKSAESRAFDRRLKSGLGHIIVRERIAQQGYYDLEEVVTKAFDGVQVRRGGGQLPTMCYHGCCTFSVYKNGSRSFRMMGTGTSATELQSLLATRTDRLYAVEFYVGQTEMPAEYFGETAVACGVIGYWTKSPG